MIYNRYTSYSLNLNNIPYVSARIPFTSLYHTLSYPLHLSLVEVNGFEPMTPSLQS